MKTTVTEAVPVADETKLSVQSATPRVPVDTSWHCGFVKLSRIPVSEKLTEPDGVTCVPGFDELSVTVAVHVEASSTTTGLLQETEVVVERMLIVILALIELALLPWTLLDEV